MNRPRYRCRSDAPPPTRPVRDAGIALLLTVAIFLVLPLAERTTAPQIPPRMRLFSVDLVTPPPPETSMPPAILPAAASDSAAPPAPLESVPPSMPSMAADGLPLAPLSAFRPASPAFPWDAIDILDADAVSAPRRIGGVSPHYPARARLQGMEGEVEAVFSIDARGRVRYVEIRRDEPPGFFAAAVRDALATWRFEPADENGRPAVLRLRQVFRFTLN